ncbi:hypothetical protein BC827DRAFT_1262776 [Russula dissimulans]|nr:hypothetical protein BC827DRAFT_1262776 [Russula dissimulans]
MGLQHIRRAALDPHSRGGILLYAVFFADFGDREHVFMPPRRWLQRQREAFFTITPEERKLIEESMPQRTRDETSKQDSARYVTEFGDEDFRASENTTTDASSPATTGTQDDVPTADGPANAERHALKRSYLTLLPHTQLVELCLAFEAYSPLHVKSSLWPTNLAAAVAELQSPPRPSSHHTPKNPPSAAVADVPPSSISSHHEATAQSSSPTGAVATSPAIDPQLHSNNTNDHPTTTTDQPPGPQQSQVSSDDTHRPAPQSEPSTTPAVTAPPQGSYPPAPYGYPSTQSLPAYPHTPYYPPFNYSYNYPPHPSTSYPHATFPPSQPPFSSATHRSGSPFTAVPLARHPHPMGLPPTDHSGIPADDLPSYEDMLVEALADLNEPEGSAPKSLFAWMASRYPLHTNFRPSASQALQKAFKRGRLEKGSNGKYRLNSSWDGGSTSKRTTRRPQSFAQMALPTPHGAPTTSPFTHAPLSQPARGTLASNPSSAGRPSQEKAQQYPPYPYPYPPGVAYPRYTVSVAPPPASKGESSADKQTMVTGSDADAQATPGESNATNEGVGEGSDAWEAAQAILKAINFGSPLQVTAAKPTAAPLCQASPPVNLALAGPAPASDRTNDASAAAAPVHVLSDGDRASLQAQLALLAAQLAEIAEDTLASDLNVTDEDADAGAEEGNGAAGEEDDMEVVDIPQQTGMH